MALSYRARRALSILVLVVALPVYVVVVVNIITLFERPALWVEFLIYVGLGILWAVLLRPVFLGVGKADPDAPRPPE